MKKNLLTKTVPLLVSALLALGLCGCAKGEVVIKDVGTPIASVGNERVYYQIFVGSFSDSNGDGIGDLRGIINRFDYLNDGDDNSGKSLGVEGIWLSPILTSPSYHKYDVADYYEVDPKFGTMDDLKELIALCKERNVQIILDTVINHTSSKHPWFIKFREARINNDTKNEFYDYYSLKGENPGSATYSILQGTDLYYESNFSHEMPELNFDNPAVRQAMVDMAKFYLDMGVDGFRFDAAKYIYFGDTERSADFWKWYMAELRKIKPDIYAVGEVWDSDGATYPYIAHLNCFNFSMSQNSGQIARAARNGNVGALTSYMERYIADIRQQNPDAMPITFISNHDMDRCAGYLLDSTNVAEVAANLSILMPGSSFIYYGEEIGMLGSRGGANTDANRRLAMNWGDEDTVKNPVGSTYSAEQMSGSVADQLIDENSLYNHYKKLIAIRKANPEIARGTFKHLELDAGYTGGFTSTYEGKTVAVLHNPTTAPVKIDLSQYSDLTAMQIAAFAGIGEAKIEGSILTLDGQTSVVLR